jgi:hypothetical protein
MTLDRLNLADLTTIAENMRPWDRAEIFATRWNDSVDELARDAMSSYDFGWIASHEGTPVCAIGGIPIHPGVWSVWMFATPDFEKIRVSLTRFALRQIKPVLMDVSRRVECRSMEGHQDAQKWLEFLGMSREAVLPQYGRNGETFLLYSYTQPSTIIEQCASAAAVAPID